MKVGNNIRKIREMRDMTQAELADKISMSQNGYCKIERDETEVTLARLIDIAKGLNVEIKEILEFDSEKALVNITNLTTHDSSTTLFDTSGSAFAEMKKIYEDRFSDIRTSSAQSLQMIKEQYEARIEAQQKEIDRLHTLLEKALSK